MEHILLLHGAIGSEEQLQPLKALLQSTYTVHSFNFSGHGGKPFGEAFSIAAFSGEIAAYLEENGIGRAYIFGYSMGGYAALYLAAQQPEKIAGIITLATKFNWDEATALKETAMLNPQKIEEKIPAFAASLAKRHLPNDWKELLHKTAAMMLEMGQQNPLATADYAKIKLPVLLMLGDRDKMVSLEETLAVYKALPHAALSILPYTDHPVEKTDAARLLFEIEQFIQGRKQVTG